MVGRGKERKGGMERGLYIRFLGLSEMPFANGKGIVTCWSPCARERSEGGIMSKKNGVLRRKNVQEVKKKWR